MNVVSRHGRNISNSFSIVKRLHVLFWLTSTGIWSCHGVKIHTRTKTSLQDDEKRPNVVKNLQPWLSEGNETFELEENSHSENSITRMFQDKFNAAYDSIVQEIQPLRDAWDGMKSAYILTWTGFYEGFGGLFLEYPWEGFSRDGVMGLLTGTTAGIIHFTSMTTSGIVAGLYQAVRGVEQTFVAIQASRDGMLWHDIRKEWYFYSLDQEGKNMDSKERSSSSSSNRRQQSRRLRKHVKDVRFYHLLNVAVDASSSDIKRAYYQQALMIHPDKSSESDAVEHFRLLNTAYKTLISRDARDMYDRHGICFADQALSEESARLEPYIFFSILFGTSVVEPYVGDLAIASIVDNTLHLTDRAEMVPMGDSTYTSSPQQLRRQIEIAYHLRNRIQNFTDGVLDEEDFTASCRAETVSLAFAMEDSVQAGHLLKAISSGILGALYDNIWTKPFALVSTSLDKAKSLKNVYDLENQIRLAIRDSNITMNPENPQSRDECNIQGNDDMDNLLTRLSVPKMLKLIWKFNMNDITMTVREACKRVIDDSASNSELRMKRAQALNILGREFASAIKSREEVYRGDKWVFPDSESIQKSVRKALIEAIVTENFV